MLGAAVELAQLHVRAQHRPEEKASFMRESLHDITNITNITNEVCCDIMRTLRIGCLLKLHGGGAYPTRRCFARLSGDQSKSPTTAFSSLVGAAPIDPRSMCWFLYGTTDPCLQSHQKIMSDIGHSTLVQISHPLCPSPLLWFRPRHTFPFRSRCCLLCLKRSMAWCSCT
jgi:hypothetical protein